MTPAEIEIWRHYYRLFPFDDAHRFHRPAALVAARMGGDGFEKDLQFLHPEPFVGDFTDADMRTLQAFGLKGPRG